MPLQIRRGLSSDLTATVIPSEGEPIFTVDTGKLYIGDGINNGQTLQPVNRDIFLGDLQDVNGFSFLDGYILRYNGTTSNWEAQELLISSFSEFSLGVGSEGSVLRFDDNPANPTYGTYTTAFLSTNDLNDVDSLASPIDGDVLVYNATSGYYSPQPPSGGSISTASDVALTSLSDGQALLYDSASGTWQNQTLSSGGALSLDNLTDVSASAPNDGDIIAYNASTSTWVTTAAPSGGGGGLSSRTTAFATTASIADGSSDDITITAAKTYALLTIETSAAAWVTLYTDATSRTNDASRSETTDPLPGSGVLAEVVTTGATTQLMTPGTIGFNYDSPAASSVYAKVVNKSGSTQSITVTLGFVAMEA